MDTKDFLDKVKEKDEYFIFEIQDVEEKKIYDELESEGYVYTNAEGAIKIKEDAFEQIENTKSNGSVEDDELQAHTSKQSAEEALEDLKNLKDGNNPLINEFYSNARMAFSFADDAELSFKEKKRIYRLVNDMRFLSRLMNNFSE